MGLISFTISGGIPSKKNRHIIKKNHRTGRSYIGSDDEYHLWEVTHATELAREIPSLGDFRGQEHLRIEYHFRVARNKDGTPCRKRWDISNKIESINDMIVKAGLIDDDNHLILSSLHATVEDGIVNEVTVVLSLNL